MKIQVQWFLTLALISLGFLSPPLASSVRADSAPYRFSMEIALGKITGAQGDPACISTIEDMIHALRNQPPETASCLSYNNVTSCSYSAGSTSEAEEGEFAFPQGPFEIILRGQQYRDYRFERTFSGMLFAPNGQGEISAQSESDGRSCAIQFVISVVYGQD